MDTTQRTATGALYRNRFWIMAAAVLFLLSGLLMYFFPPNLAGVLVSGRMEGLGKMVEEIMARPPLAAAALIFFNNLVVALQMLVLGAIAGISPILTLGLNGSLLGSIASLAMDEGMTRVHLLASIVPHGIFELPAFFICGGLGLRLGYRCTLSPLPGLTRFESFRHIWKDILVVLPLVVVLLVVAALVEIFITLPFAKGMMEVGLLQPGL